MGCGDIYLPGFINIDYIKEYRPAQATNRPDYFVDVMSLRFPLNSISKIENHHMFELRGLKIVFETPDFAKLFGSHEAFWVYYYDAWF